MCLFYHLIACASCKRKTTSLYSVVALSKKHGSASSIKGLQSSHCFDLELQLKCFFAAFPIEVQQVVLLTILARLTCEVLWDFDASKLSIRLFMNVGIGTFSGSDHSD